MPAIEKPSHILGLFCDHLSKREAMLLEGELLVCICNELLSIFRSQYKHYNNLIKVNTEMEDVMLEDDFLRNLIKEILMTEEYSIKGIAYYTQSTEDVICDLVTGKHSSPSLQLSKKIISLHKSVYPNIYKEILTKVLINKEVMVACD